MQSLFEKFIKVLFSPFTWAVGFIWPLTTQILIAGGALGAANAIWVGALIALPWGLMAQLRGSWIWVK